jgi:hypothetical protein
VSVDDALEAFGVYFAGHVEHEVRGAGGGEAGVQEDGSSRGRGESGTRSRLGPPQMPPPLLTPALPLTPPQGYDKLLNVLGSNIAEFLGNLNNLHLHMSVVWPAIAAPAFKVDKVRRGSGGAAGAGALRGSLQGEAGRARRAPPISRPPRPYAPACARPRCPPNSRPLPKVTPTSLELHYYSSRPGLWSLVVGVLKSMAPRYCGIAQLGIKLIAARHLGNCDHEVRRAAWAASRGAWRKGGKR